LVVASLLTLALIEGQSARAQTFTVLHTFTGRGDGKEPPGVIRDAKGNLYGSTFRGGAFDLGTVFRLDETGKETILYSFTGGDGLGPNSGLVRDPAGNLYGTTYYGGTSEGGRCHYGCGTVFELDNTGKETVLWAFSGGTDGGTPLAGVIRDNTGNLYGTTLLGGQGFGVVFKLSRSGKQTILHSFTGGEDAYPTAGLIRDTAGNLYSTASSVGCCGVVFKLDKNGKETVLYRFRGGSDGNYPIAGLVRDAEGNLYGTTVLGGDLSCGQSGQGCGVVFKVPKTGKETVLHTFVGYPTDGAFPNGMVRDAECNLYGTTEQGGDVSNCNAYGVDDCGTVFKVDKTGKEILLYSFSGGSDSADPVWVIRDGVGDLYGTTLLGGDASCDCGLVFRLTP
jgi:uncharacterized repeat protein (TIGR03803 family)